MSASLLRFFRGRTASAPVARERLQILLAHERSLRGQPDYHGSMEAYAAAKSRLFDTPGLRAAVLNLDDGVGMQLAKRLTARGVRTIFRKLLGGN